MRWGVCYIAIKVSYFCKKKVGEAGYMKKKGPSFSPRTSPRQIRGVVESCVDSGARGARDGADKKHGFCLSREFDRPSQSDTQLEKGEAVWRRVVSLETLVL